jgi:predicted nucleotidyltransferase
MLIDFDPNRLANFCQCHGIARLELFGSALGPDFRPDSDVDLLATLRPDAGPTLLDWAEMQIGLAEIFGRPVDLVSRRAIEASKNPYRKTSILATAQPIYGEG